MQTVGTYEAKTRLPRLLNDVEHGDTVVITRYGRPIAKIVPFEDTRRAERRAAVDALIEYRKTAPRLEGTTAKELIELGRRY